MTLEWRNASLALARWTMVDASEPVSPWWKCSGYEIIDGHICPTPVSSVEQYEPWLAFEKFRHTAKIGDQYLSLLNLHEQLRERCGTERIASADLTEADNELITTWCIKNGLLGLLHHRALAIWREPFDQRDGPLSMIDAVAWRRGGRWLSTCLRPAEPNHTLARTFAVPAQALFEHRLGGPVKPLPLESLRDQFFPRLRSSGSTTIPIPGDENFWREYSEPVSMFLEAMGDLGRAVEFSRRKPDSANATMVDLLTGVAPIGVRRAGKGFTLEWSCPSLLASLATMALICHDQKQPPGRCAECFGWFVGSVSTEYCTLRCQNTANVRRRRARKKAASPPPGKESS